MALKCNCSGYPPLASVVRRERRTTDDKVRSISVDGAGLVYMTGMEYGTTDNVYAASIFPTDSFGATTRSGD